MQKLFFMVLRMSLEGSVVILAVLLARLLLAKAPKKYSYFLWLVVGLRLACPIQIQSAFSLFRLPGLRRVNSVDVGPVAPMPMDAPVPMEPVPSVQAVVPKLPSEPAVPVPQAVSWSPMQVLAAVWLVGALCFVLYSVLSEMRLRRSLATATKMQDNVFQCENVGSPFVLGVLRPRIYMPYGLSQEAQRCVLAHEQTHLRRADPLFRRIAFLILAAHWFNPLCWLAFQRMGMDMELSCDEAVLKQGNVDPKQYSLTLLAFAANRRSFAAAPLSFGETGVKKRIKNALDWKNPGAVLTVLALVLSCGITAACAADPKEAEEPPQPEVAEQEVDRKQNIPCARAEYYFLPDDDRLEEYDAEGWLLRIIMLNDERRVTSFEEHYYDQDHNEVEVKQIDPEMFPTAYDFVTQDQPERIREYAEGNGELVSDYWQQYDEYGRVKQKETKDAEGNLTHREQYEYAPNGKISVKKYLGWDASLGKMAESISHYEYNEQGTLVYEKEEYGPGHGSGETYWNDRGQLTEVTAYKPDGTLKYREKYDRDEYGRDIGGSLTNSYGTVSQRSLIEYDPDYFDRKQRVRHWRFGLLRDDSSFEYSDTGYTEYTKYYQNKQLFKSEKRTYDWEDRVLEAYYFDANGNEISQDAFYAK